MNILVIGTIYLDIKGHPYEAFIPDGRNAGYVEYVHGGVGRNIAEDIVNIGADCTFLSAADPGPAGDEIISYLKDAGVKTRFIERAPQTSGTWLAVFDEKGDVVSSISGRPDLSCLADVLDKHHEKIFANTDAVILELDIAPAAVEKVFRYAAEYGTKVYCAVATMSSALPLLGYLREAELFICNRQEAGMLFDMDLSPLSVDSLAETAAKLLPSKEISNIIITDSGNGSVYIGSDGTYGVCPAVETKLVDSTGAGDSFCAGAVISLTMGNSLADACSFASKVAAAVVSTQNNTYRGFRLLQ